MLSTAPARGGHLPAEELCPNIIAVFQADMKSPDAPPPPALPLPLGDQVFLLLTVMSQTAGHCHITAPVHQRFARHREKCPGSPSRALRHQTAPNHIRKWPKAGGRIKVSLSPPRTRQLTSTPPNATPGYSSPATAGPQATYHAQRPFQNLPRWFTPFEYRRHEGRNRTAPSTARRCRRNCGR